MDDHVEEPLLADDLLVESQQLLLLLLFDCIHVLPDDAHQLVRELELKYFLTVVLVAKNSQLLIFDCFWVSFGRPRRLNSVEHRVLVLCF